MKEKCEICNNNNWLELPDPNNSLSVTTTGKIIKQPLGKSLCSMCGFVKRNKFNYLGQGEYYQEDYAPYYERPGIEEYHRRRYKDLAEWMSKYLLDAFNFKKVLDVGSGQGWMMDAMSSRYDGIEIFGIEPNRYNAAIAKQKGYTIIENKIEHSNMNDTYDLVYSNNVLQHVNDIGKFIADMKMLLSEHGVIIATCPDGSRPSIDLFWSDHNYSFLPDHLRKIGRDFGFETVWVTQSLENPSIPPAQLLCMTNNPSYQGKLIGEKETFDLDIIQFYSSRVEYLQSIKRLNDFLMQEISGFSAVYNFGASYWTSIIAAYCPDYWKIVDACVIDKQDSIMEFMGKNVVELGSLQNLEQAAMVLGTAPVSHDKLAPRFSEFKKIIKWDTLIRY